MLVKEMVMRKYGVGDRVAQPQYGPGTVIESNDRHTVIDFDDHGLRRFITAMVVLESSATAAPPKRSGRRKRAQ
jgi:hypothetical protein